MINHGRCLLLNVEAGGVESLGEEYVPPEFFPVTLSAELEAVRRSFFGAAPDRGMLNYRAAQLLATVHATPLVEYLLALDPRITYEPGRPGEFAAAGAFTPAVFKQQAQAGEELVVFAADGTPPDASGITRYAYTVTVVDGGLLIERHIPTLYRIEYATAWTHQLSEWRILPGSGQRFRVTTDRVGASWQVDVLLRPQQTPGELIAQLAADNGLVEPTLFGVAAEPERTFQAIWRNSRETPLRVAAVVLGLVRRTEERRIQHASR